MKNNSSHYKSLDYFLIQQSPNQNSSLQPPFPTKSKFQNSTQSNPKNRTHLLQPKNPKKASNPAVS